MEIHLSELARQVHGISTEKKGTIKESIQRKTSMVDKETPNACIIYSFSIACSIVLYYV